MELLGVVLLLVAAMLLEGWLYSRYGLRHLQYRCYFQQKEVPEGSVLELVEELENQKFLPLPWLKAELTLPKWLEVSGAHTVQTGEVQVLTSIFAVKSYSQVRRTWQVRANKRGTYSIEHALLMTANLLGNTRQSMRVEDRGNPILVLPIPYEQAAPVWQQLLAFGDAQTLQRRGLPDPFYSAGVRPYQAGDAWNRIHWNATAKAQQLMVRQELYTAVPSIRILLNLQTDPDSASRNVWHADRLEHSIRVALRCVQEALLQGISVQLWVNGCISGAESPYSVIMLTRMAQEPELRRFLARLEDPPTQSLSQFLQEVPPCGMHEAQICITPYTTKELQAWRRRQRMSRILVTARGMDPLGLADAVLPPAERKEVDR